MKKLLFLVTAAALMAACSDSPTAPAAANKAPTAKASHDDPPDCPFGYTPSFNIDTGTWTCDPQ